MFHMSFDLPEDEEYWKSQYVDRVSDMKNWIETAKDLVRALQFLRAPAIQFFKGLASSYEGDIATPNEKRNDVQGVYMMLAAYAIENLMKIIVINDSKLQIDAINPKLPKVIATHDLVSLAQSAGVSLTTEGVELMARLSRYAVWAARYPATTKVDALKPTVMSDGSMRYDSVQRGFDIRGIDNVLIHCFRRLGEPHIIPAADLGYGADREPWEAVYILREVRVG